MSDFGSEAFVVHQKEVKLPHVANEEFLVAIGEKMTCLKRKLIIAQSNQGNSADLLVTSVPDLYRY